MQGRTYITPVRWSIWLLVSFLIACSSGSSTPADTETDARASVGGYIFVSDGSSKSNGLQFSRDSNPPSGHSALVGGNISVVGQNESTTTDATGFFQLNALFPGQAVLNIKQNGQSLADIPLNLLNDVLTQLGDPGVSRQQAADAVTTALLARGENPAHYTQLALLHSLPSAVLLQANEDPEQQTFDDAEFALTPSFTLNRESWFFYLDRYTQSRYGHPVLWALIDAETAEVQFLERYGPPFINGHAYFNQRFGYADAAELIDEATLPSGPATQEDFVETQSRSLPLSESFSSKHEIEDCEEGEGEVFAVLIAGFNESDISHDVQKVAARLNSVLGVPIANIQVVNVGVVDLNTAENRNATNPTSQLVQPVIRRMYERMDKCDTYFLYISTHGNERGPANKLQRRSFMKNLKGEFEEREDLDQTIYNAEYLLEARNGADELLNPACHVAVVADSCWSGNYIDTRAKFNGNKSASLKNFRYQLQDMTGRHGFIATATDRKHTALSFEEDGQAELGGVTTDVEKGGLYTNTFLNALEKTATNLSAYERLLAAANAAKASGLNQAPQVFAVNPTDDCAPKDIPDPTPNPSPTPSTSPQPSPTPTPTDAPSPSPTLTPTATPTDPPPSPTPVTTPSPTPTVTPTPDPSQCRAGVRFEVAAQSSDGVNIRFEAANTSINGGQLISLSPGNVFEEIQSFDRPNFDSQTVAIDNLDLIYRNDGNEFAQNFEFDIECGRWQVFIQNGNVLEFFEENLPN